MSITFNINGSMTLDETSGLQNGSSIPLGDKDDNDIALSTLPTAFHERLFGSDPGELGLDPTYATNVGAAASASNFIDITTTSTISNLSFTDSAGNALNGADSGLMTLDGLKIYLYTDATNDNIVLGRVGDADGPLEGGTIVFSAYIDEQTTGDAKIWMVTLAPIKHADTTSADDSVDIDEGVLFVSAAENLTFVLSGLDSGQNLWNVFSDLENTTQIIVSTDTAGQTVNTSKGGGSTTIGNSNQLMDGVGSSEDPNGNALVFTFVTGSPELLTQVVDNDPNTVDINYGDLSTIKYNALQSADEAEFSISQTQGGSPYAVATVTALRTDPNLQQADFNPPLTGDEVVAITSVTITNANSGFTFTATREDGVTLPHTDSVTRVISNKLSFELKVTFNADGTVTIEGLRAKDAIGYTTDGDHNRVKIHNTGDDASTLDWDIGGFRLLDTGVESVDIGPDLNIEDDGPRFVAVETGLVHEDALTTAAAADLSAGNRESNTQTKTASGSLSDNVSSGTDAPASFSLASATGPALNSKGVALTYVVTGTAQTGYTLTASAGTRTVFTWQVNADGTWTFDLNDQLDHSSGAGDAGLLTIDLTPFLVVKDAEGDPASLPTNFVTIQVENDVPKASQQPVSATVHEDALVTPGDLSAGNGEVTTPAQTKTAQGSVAVLVLGGADEDVIWSLAANPANPVGLTSKGAAVTYSVLGNVLTATAGGRTVFTLTLQANGDYIFELNDQLDHTNLGDGGLLSIDLSAVLRARDFDNDAFAPPANAFVIQVENDVPKIGPIADGTVDFAKNDFDTNPLNGSIGADDNVSNAAADGTRTYTFSSFTTPTTGIANLKGELIENDTRVVYFTDGAGGMAGKFDLGIDILYYDVVLSQTGAGAYTFTVYQDPVPALIEFPLSTLASGQNRWNAFGTTSDQIIVISDEAAQTVNTSKGGGSTTIGNSNQMLDGVDPLKDQNGEAMVLTFVENASGLLAADKGSLAGIQYTTLKNAEGGEWSIAQTQGGSPFGVATMAALKTAVETGNNFFTGLSNDGPPVAITSVTLKITEGSFAGGGTTFTAELADANAQGQVTVLRTISSKLSFTVTVTFNSDGTVKIAGLRAKDAIGYTTDGDHNRLKLQNTGNDASSLDWDIGGFKLVEAQPTPDQKFDFTVDITDYDGDNEAAADDDEFSVTVDGTGPFDSGSFGDSFIFA